MPRPYSDEAQYLHVIGATGSGKSTLLGNMILADAEAGRGIVLIDPKGDLVTDVLSRLPRSAADRVVIFDADSKSRPPDWFYDLRLTTSRPTSPCDAAPTEVRGAQMAEAQACHH